MAAVKPLTLRLDGEDYNRLEAEARNMGIRPGTLARMLVRAGLRDAGRGRREDLVATLAWLSALRESLPSVDAVKVVQRGRLELSRRQVR